jgi:hypothetical protein
MAPMPNELKSALRRARIPETHYMQKLAFQQGMLLQAEGVVSDAKT